MVNQFTGSAVAPPQFTRGYGLAFGEAERKAMAMALVDRALHAPELGEDVTAPAQDAEFVLYHGWGTGGIQVTASVIGPDDVLKVIDQGADDTTNAVSIRRFFARTAGVRTTTRTVEATLIQTRHRIPETPLDARQIVVFQVPIPEPLRWLEPRESETRVMHALEDYGVCM